MALPRHGEASRAAETDTQVIEDFEAAHSYRGVGLVEAAHSTPTICAAVRELAEARSAEPYLSGLLPGGSADVLTFGELERRSRAAAGWLLARGARPGDTIGVLPRNDVASVIAVFGVLRAGCTASVLGHTDPVGRIREQAAAAGAHLVLRPSTVDSGVFPDAVELPASPLTAMTVDELPPDPAAAAAAFVFPTSGSTASSKLVEQSHLCLTTNARAIRAVHRIKPGDRLLTCLPIHHVNGMHFTVMGALAAGAHTVLAPEFDPFSYPGLIAAHRPRIASVVPSILEALRHAHRGPMSFEGLEYFVTAAAPLAATTAHGVSESGGRVHQGYGLTETTNFSTQLPARLPDEPYRLLIAEAEVPSVGLAVPGNEVAVLRPDGSAAGPGETGEVCMRGHNVMTGYRGNPLATAEAFRGGWFHSGDLGHTVLAPGQPEPFFVLSGRTKNIAKVRGQAVSLEEMERVLLAVPGVADAGCVAMPHPFFGEHVAAAIVPRRADEPVDVLPALRAAFPAAVLPERIAALPAVPRTPTGKLRRSELRTLLEP